MRLFFCVVSLLCCAAWVSAIRELECAPTPGGNSMGLRYYNWDGEKSCSAASFIAPSSEAELANLLKAAGSGSSGVKVVGGGLSFSGIQLMDEGNLLSLHRMNRILNVNMQKDGSGSALVEVEAGVRVRDLVLHLDTLGLAMINLGATANQTIAGATATGTHGTGTKLGAMATSIKKLRLVTMDGSVLSLSHEDDGDLFRAAATGLGRLGVVSVVTLHVVPQWKMQLSSVQTNLEGFLSTELPQLLAAHDRLQWSFEPYADTVTYVLRLDVPNDTPITPAATESDPEGGCWGSQPRNPCVDKSYKTLTDNAAHFAKRSRYTEMEMFIDASNLVPAIRKYIDFMDTIKTQKQSNSTINVMVRYVAGDDLLLSPMQGRDTAVISVIVLGDAVKSGDQRDFELYASGLQNICQTHYSGRPHWGKVNFVDENTPKYLSSTAYPKTMSIFKDIAQRLDPAGVLINEYLKERLGDEQGEGMHTKGVM